MILNVSAGRLVAGARNLRCAIGKAGIVPASRKREGDHATPIGLWALRGVLYRPDRVGAPASRLAVKAIGPNDGWCDDPADDSYNRQVALPYPAHCESMWRMDGLYDVVVPLGYNDGEVRPGAGSAIFLHCASPEFTPTEGCVAIDREALVELVAHCQPGDALAVG